MRVKCTQCGKHFDYNMHFGKCPKCFTYYTKDSNEEPRKKSKHSRSYHIVTIVSLAIIILSVEVSMIIPYTEDNFSFAIKEATIIQDSNYQIPSGYELIRVTYSAGIERPYGAPSDEEYGHYESYNLRHGLHPYLITKSGSYLPPLSKYDFEKTKILESESADELELSTYFQNTVGYFYFLVKENDTKGLRINCHSKQTNAWGNSVEPLEACYEIDDLEVY